MSRGSLINAMPMKIATWNVNSLKVRLPQVEDWLVAHQPDVLCLQEIKLDDPFFPVEAITQAGYHAAFAGQKTYNGVALISRAEMTDIQRGIPGFADEQKRMIAGTAGDVRVVCAYFPNGQSVGSDKYEYKLRWIAALTDWLKEELKRYPKLVLTGDFNIAPADLDVHDPKAWHEKILCSAPERAAYQGLLALGLHDAYRQLTPETPGYTWWDYRTMAFRRNLGLRIDLLLVSDPLSANCLRCEVDRTPRETERPSDHAPVFLELAGLS